MRASTVYPDEAFVFAETAEQAHDAGEVVRRMQQVLGGVGITYFGVSSLPHGRQSLQDLLLANVAPPEWVNLYSTRQYLLLDPVISRLRHSVMPFEWRASADFEGAATGGEVMARRLEFGIRAGICVPVPRRDGLAFVAMSGALPEVDARLRPLAHLVAIYALDRIRSFARPDRPVTALTEREREVLTWIAAGKSAWEIGQILRIAKRTVDEHAQTAARKLGAVNRTQAVAIALRDRAIAI